MTPVQSPIVESAERKDSFLTRRARKQFCKLMPVGITVNGSEPHDPQITDERTYSRVLLQGSLGLGEAYMDGWWDCAALDQFFAKAATPELFKKLSYSPPALVQALRQRLFNLQKSSKAFEIAEHHYNLGNDLYAAMLDSRMVYTCAYWKDAKSLDAAQEAKLDLVCKKIDLKPGMSLLDIGCGWGGLARYAAEKYGARVVGVTVSSEQVELAQRLCKGLPVEIRLQDYRDVREKFDRIASVGCLEHVGPKNYRTYMKTAHRCLKDDGLFLVHSIGSTDGLAVDPWIFKYIFPSAVLPFQHQINASSHGLFHTLDTHEFGTYYDLTLMEWYKNFEARWPEFASQYDERFYRMWKYYLLFCAGLFRSGIIKLWQVVLSKEARAYEPVR